MRFLQRSRRVTPSKTHRPQGFTLIEIMLVMVIIGIMAGLASLAIGSNGPRQLQQEATRLQQRLLLAQDEAAFSQQNFGVIFTETGYRFLRYDATEDQWNPLQAMDEEKQKIQGLGNYTYDIPVELSLEISGTVLKLLPDETSNKTSGSTSSHYGNFSLDSDAEEQGDLQPELLLLANGESSAFTITLQLEDDTRSTQTLHSDGFSPITRTGHNSE
ncbi:type II secretion system minor pseudopilin GspH [Aestuariicella sp. G3-2]|uniref:type II secretion system minor pseudopilin GspH n=1 Tax=Pseudomaricurvus albidus TaxID=2842452 RepID=UPI001C0B2E29|nr:type II secretion system minor pseudopilin GspH [Aestuariicella albida]MBU3071519.1 type II secretion system minor pseudopilin GspH [Aestuariicella albida]